MGAGASSNQSAARCSELEAENQQLKDKVKELEAKLREAESLNTKGGEEKKKDAEPPGGVAKASPKECFGHFQKHYTFERKVGAPASEVVVCSTSETSLEGFNIMEGLNKKMEEAEFLQLAYSWAGAGAQFGDSFDEMGPLKENFLNVCGREGKESRAAEEAFAKFHDWLLELQWWSSFVGQIMVGLRTSALKGCPVVAAVIPGGPITTVEQQEMPNIVKSTLFDLNSDKLGVAGQTYEISVKTFSDFAELASYVDFERKLRDIIENVDKLFNQDEDGAVMVAKKNEGGAFLNNTPDDFKDETIAQLSNKILTLDDDLLQGDLMYIADPNQNWTKTSLLVVAGMRDSGKTALFSKVFETAMDCMNPNAMTGIAAAVKDVVGIGALPLQLAEGEDGVAENLLTKLIKDGKDLRKVGVLLRGTGKNGCAADLLKGMNTLKLQKANLGASGQGQEAVKFLAEALQQNTDITEVYLSDNQITQVGAQAIAEMLKQNSTIQSLELSNNSIGNDGLEAILEALKQNTTLETLHLQNAKITRLSSTLAEVLNTHPKLRAVVCNFNEIDDDAKRMYGNDERGRVVVDAVTEY